MDKTWNDRGTGSTHSADKCESDTGNVSYKYELLRTLSKSNNHICQTYALNRLYSPQVQIPTTFHKEAKQQFNQIA